MHETLTRVGVTLLFWGLIASFALPGMWPPSQVWVPVILAVIGSGVAAGWLWSRYFNDYADDRWVEKELRSQQRRTDRPAAPPPRPAGESRPRSEPQQASEWPPKDQSF